MSCCMGSFASYTLCESSLRSVNISVPKMWKRTGYLLYASLHRYAMHYLEDVIGVVDQQAAQAGADFEEKEWELEQLEKLKVRAQSFLSSFCLSIFGRSAWGQETMWRIGS
jgi:hypothetical protein